MQKLWFRAPDELVQQIDYEVEQGGYKDRSEYLRQIAREAVDE